MRRSLFVLLFLAFLPAVAAHAANDGAVLASVTLAAPPPSWAQVNPHTVFHSSPVVADLFGDGQQEIIVATHDGWLYVYRWAAGQLTVAPGWPQNLGAHVGSSPAVADLDRDGRAEIVIGVGDATDLDVGNQRAGG